MAHLIRLILCTAVFLPALSKAETVSVVACTRFDPSVSPDQITASTIKEGPPLAPGQDWLASALSIMRDQNRIEDFIGHRVVTLRNTRVVNKRPMDDYGFPYTICFEVAGEPVLSFKLETSMLPPPPLVPVPASALERERFALPRLSIGILEGTRWNQGNVEPRVKLIRDLLRECGIEIEKVEYRTLSRADGRFDSILDTLGTSISRMQISSFERNTEPLVHDLPRPALVYANKYYDDTCEPQFCGAMARSYPRGLVLRTSPLADLAFLPDIYVGLTKRFHGPPELTDAHELGHILSQDPGHDREDGTVMSHGKMAARWGEAKCAQMRGSPYIERRHIM